MNDTQRKPTDPAMSRGVSLPRSQWDAIEALTGGRQGRRSRFIQDAVEAKLAEQAGKAPAGNGNKHFAKAQAAAEQTENNIS